MTTRAKNAALGLLTVVTLVLALLCASYSTAEAPALNPTPNVPADGTTAGR